jgi:putative ABC transport system ATP-binding protein
MEMNEESGFIRAENVCRYYRMGDAEVRALDGVSLEVREGEFVALLGASGSGKSSLLNLIAGLDRPTSGRVLVTGRDLAKVSSPELAQYRLRSVGMVFQAFNLIPAMTLLENVELPMRFAEVDRASRHRMALAALDRVGLGRRAQHRPSEMSGGEQQRAALARALVNSPNLLLADEPTGNLDSKTGSGIMELIHGCNTTLGMTVVLVTHEHGLAARYAARLIFMGDGKLIADQPNTPSASVAPGSAGEPSVTPAAVPAAGVQ